MILAKKVCLVHGILFLLAWPFHASAVVFVSNEINTTPSPDNFSICFDNSCKTITQLSLKEGQWMKINELFHPEAKTPAEERAKIGRAIALLETFIGEMTGTDQDKGLNEPPDTPVGHRMDCIDESTNSTTYLYLLQEAGLLHWHRLRDPVTRGFFFFGWPHTTAVIAEINEKTEWAIDSWFHDNGEVPEIIPLSLWKSGWHPEK